MTYYEFSLLVAGKAWQQKEEANRDAFLLANLINPHVKKRLKPKDFMRVVKTSNSPEDKVRQLEAALGSSTATREAVVEKAAPLKDFLDRRKGAQR